MFKTFANKLFYLIITSNCRSRVHSTNGLKAIQLVRARIRCNLPMLLMRVGQLQSEHSTVPVTLPYSHR